MILQRKTPAFPKPRKPLRPVSKKRAVENRRYAKLRQEFLAEHPFCQAQYPDICTGPSKHIHHREGRGRNLNVVSTWLGTCPECHSEIHLHPRAARVFGFLK